MGKLKIMTMNLRYRNKGDGENIFDNRLPRIKETILAERADVIGFQEITDEMTEMTRKAIGRSYEIVGCGRNADRTGEGVRLAFRRGKFELVTLETFWLSEAPYTPGSRFSADQGGCFRVATMVELMEKKTKKMLRFYNIHLDDQGELARICATTQILQHMEERKKREAMPVVLTGDFNARPDSPVIKTFDAHLCDLTKGLPGTFHNFGRIEPYKIDYIYSDLEKTGEAYLVKDTPRDGIYISDHSPVCAFVRW